MADIACRGLYRRTKMFIKNKKVIIIGIIFVLLSVFVSLMVNVISNGIIVELPFMDLVVGSGTFMGREYFDVTINYSKTAIEFIAFGK